MSDLDIHDRVQELPESEKDILRGILKKQEKEAA